MKDQLERSIKQTMELLEQCKHGDKSSWFRNHLQRLQQASCQPAEVNEIAAEIRSVLGGMGSLSDLSLVPSAESALSIRDAHKMQWSLVKELDDITGEILK